MINSNSKQDEQSQAIPFDGRQARAKLLLDWTYELSKAQANNDCVFWVKCLRNIHYLCAPFSNSKNVSAVDVSIKKADICVNFWIGRKPITYALVIRSLDFATHQTLGTYRDQFMLTSVKENNGFNSEQFDGGDI